MANVPPANIFTVVAGDEALQAVIANTKRHLGIAAQEPAPVGFLDDTTYDAELLKSLVMTNLNGGAEIQDQQVHVEYLKRSDRLKLPVILGARMSELGAADQAGFRTLMERYWKVSTRTYRQLKDWVEAGNSYPDIRTAVDALALPNPINEGLYTGWYEDGAMEIAAGVVDEVENVVLTFSMISNALGFGCDLRDAGVLNTVEMRMADNYWQTIKRDEDNLPRLQSRLYPFTLQNIAALNYVSVGNSALAAWTRAFGVSCGLLPDVNSGCVREYDFVLTRPTKETFLSLIRFEQTYNRNIKSICLNLLAMFGLLHLAKDHTFKTNDADMTRICTSYISAIRTMVPTELSEEMKGQLEPLCRTAQHPFGLGQTYAVAIIMHNAGKLAKPLQIRINVSPPPVQRLMIVNAATSEWRNVSAGDEINKMYAHAIAVVKAEIAKIRLNPPSYSGLHRLYGIEKMSEIPEAVKEAAESMMPMIYGFAMSQHCDEAQRRDGIALAMSLVNVHRDHSILAQKFITMWDAYMDEMEEEGLLKTAREARASMARSEAGV